MEAARIQHAHAAAPSRVIAIAASAGGVDALRRLAAELPGDLDAAVCVVLHIPPTGRSLLAPILDRAGPLPTMRAEHGMPLRAGTIYVAPADHHLLVRADSVELSRGPKENGVRPAADPLFRSLARAWGDCSIAVVLSGALDDGAAGAVAVTQAGGKVVVQEPADALVGGMPSAAIAATAPDAIVRLDEMGETLQRLVRATVPNPAKRLGDAYSEEAQGNAVEAALWAALEGFEERSELLRGIADRMDQTPRSEHRLRAGAREADERAGVVRRVLGAGFAP